MARFEVTGFDEITAKFEKMDSGIIPICKMSVYDGAGVVADSIRSELQAVLSGNSTGDLEASLGIQEIRDSGATVETVVGFAGYDRNGTPNPLKARVLNSGTSSTNHRKTRFISKALKKAEVPAKMKMAETATKQITKTLGG